MLLPRHVLSGVLRAQGSLVWRLFAASNENNKQYTLNTTAAAAAAAAPRQKLFRVSKSKPFWFRRLFFAQPLLWVMNDDSSVTQLMTGLVFSTVYEQINRVRTARAAAAVPTDG